MQCSSHLKRPHVKPHAAASVSYTPVQIKTFYGMPKGADGTGRKLAFVELGGGYVQADLDKYFKSLGLSVKPVVFHSIDGATNAPGDPNGADGEVMLDLCVGGAFAPGAELHLYMAPNTDSGFVNALSQACVDLSPGDAVSISWGAAENQWSSASRSAMNTALAALRAKGIVVTAAAGDNGSGDGETGQHVDFPASSPSALGCGGTSLPTLSPSAEVVWNDGTKGGATGGGISSFETLPDYQKLANVPGGKMRGVPDVGGLADPDTGWIVVIDGKNEVIGGTSAVAPMWGAIAVCLSQAAGRAIDLLSAIYASAAAAGLRDITSGSNGTFTARLHWDACTGNGVPVLAKLFQELAGSAPAPAPAPTPPPAPAPTPSPSQTRNIIVTGDNLVVTVNGKSV